MSPAHPDRPAVPAGELPGDRPGDATVRVATPADAAAIGELLAASYRRLMGPAYAAALPGMTRANPKLLVSGRFYVALRSDGACDRVVGCGGWTATGPNTCAQDGGTNDGRAQGPDAGHLRHFATDPDLLGRGIGRRLAERCEREVRALGLGRLDVFASLNAQAFYAALGFQAVRPIELALDAHSSFPAVLMTKPVAPSAPAEA